MTLSNDILTIEIASHGAEMTSLRKGKTEYLWHGDAAYWNRRSPVLFPIVGKVYQNRYRVDGQEYELPQHGFARDMDFRLVRHSHTEATYRLVSTPDTLRRYPYPFELTVRYQLEEQRVRVHWQVRNTGESTMYYQIGGHPAFLLRFLAGASTNNGFLLFESLSNDEREPLDCLRINRLSPSGYCLNQYATLPLDRGMLPLTDDTFSQGALVLEDAQAESVTLFSREGRPYLRLTSTDATVMGIWAPSVPHCPFVCIEPWMGRADREGFDRDITFRDHICACLPGETEDFTFEIEIL